MTDREARERPQGDSRRVTQSPTPAALKGDLPVQI